ncbi:glycosyltransferase [Rhodococcus koreensis]|uniref:glycosyltransferase n=1 Tax=Rhodococcus koreensis TaxID=99653 RepID=UPI001FCA473F|nr:glycosyltransferase [Rhodococcus koreensis]
MTGIAPYTTGLARGLARSGHDVRVVTGFPHYPAWKVDAEYTGMTRNEQCDGVNIRRVRQYTPSAPNNANRILLEGTFGLRAATQNWDNPDVIVCVTPALISAAMIVARARVAAKNRPGIGIWVQDLYSRGIIETSSAPHAFARGAHAFESATLRAADGIAVIHERFRQHLCSELSVDDSKIDVIRNWTHVKSGAVRDALATRQLLNWNPTETVVLHAGNMGAKQGLENVVEAARLAENTSENIRFVLLGDGNQRAKLEHLGSSIPNLQFVRPLNDFDFRSALNAADMLLVNELPHITDMAVPSKLTTYFATGKSVVAATNEHSTTAQEIKASGGGIIVPPGDPARLLSAVIELAANQPLATELGKKGLQFHANNLSEEAALDKFDRWVNRLAARNSLRRTSA